MKEKSTFGQIYFHSVWSKPYNILVSSGKSISREEFMHREGDTKVPIVSETIFASDQTHTISSYNIINLRANKQ